MSVKAAREALGAQLQALFGSGVVVYDKPVAVVERTPAVVLTTQSVRPDAQLLAGRLVVTVTLLAYAGNTNEQLGQAEDALNDLQGTLVRWALDNAGRLEPYWESLTIRGEGAVTDATVDGEHYLMCSYDVEMLIPYSTL